MSFGRDIPLPLRDTMPTLHYIHDPLCGWCYAAAPLIGVAAQRGDLSLRLHGGGLMTGERRRTIAPDWRAHVLPHDRRIAALSGQPFGEAYLDGLLRRDGTLLDSEPPITAVLAAHVVAQRGLAMLERMQRAHFVEGRVIADPAVLTTLAEDIGLGPFHFMDAFELLTGDATRLHIREARQRMTQAGGAGFPTLVLETADGARQRLDPSPWFGRPDAWQAHLDTVIASSA